MIIILLLLYSFGLLAHGTKYSPVWQILALEIPELTMLSSSQPVQLHENVWFWLSRESGCKWSRQGRNELNNSWAGPWPGLKSNLALADLPLLSPASPHRCLMVTGQLSHGRAGVPIQPSLLQISSSRADCGSFSKPWAKFGSGL